MADQSNGGLTQIIVAVIGVVGVVAAALFANWDKIFPDDRTVPKEAGAVVEPRPAEARPPVVVNDVPAQSGKGDAVSPTKPSADPQTSTAPVAALPDLAGDWHDGDGYTYAVSQHGGAIDYIQRQNGANVGTGTGTLIGHTMHYTWEGGGNKGSCFATVADDVRSFAGTCTDGTSRWPFRVDR